jgi:methionyl-tRNA formyltransferase
VKILFYGTSEFACPALRTLARHSDFEVVGVVTQPDRPKGRSGKVTPPPVKMLAMDLHCKVFQPETLKSPAVLAQLKYAKPDFNVVVSYGKLLQKDVLELPQYGSFNIHASLLPKYRGPAPIQRAIEHGETTTGVTIMRVDEELDHGPMLAVATTEIGPDERTPSLAARLSRLGAEALAEVLASQPTGTPQDHAAATHAPKIEKSEGSIRWTETTAAIYNKFRAFDPWPGVFAGDLKLIEIEPADGRGKPGTILSANPDGVIIATGDGALRLITVQRAGKPKAAAADVLRGIASL